MNENKLQIFNNEEFGEIRTKLIGEEPWFVGKDVAAALGYADASKAIRVHVGEEDKGVDEMVTPGGTQKIIFINESGLYSLVLSSRLESARKFKKWITSEVIPSIRKHGAYVAPDTLERMISSPEFGIRLLNEIKKEREQRIALEQQVEKDKPKVIFAGAVETAKTSILVGELAKILKQNGIEMGQKRLFSYLRENGYLMKDGSSQNMPTQKSMEKGLFEIKETVVCHADGHTAINKTPKVTGKGQVYFTNLFLGQQTEIQA